MKAPDIGMARINNTDLRNCAIPQHMDASSGAKLMFIVNGKGSDASLLASRTVNTIKKSSYECTSNTTPRMHATKAHGDITALTERTAGHAATRRSSASVGLVVLKGLNFATVNGGGLQALFFPQQEEPVTVFKPTAKPAIGNHANQTAASTLETGRILLSGQPGTLVIGSDQMWGPNQENASAIEFYARCPRKTTTEIAIKLAQLAATRTADNSATLVARIVA